MKDQMTQAVEERLAPLTERIETLERSSTREGNKAIAERSAEEDDIMRQLNVLMQLATQAGSVFSRTVRKKLQSLEARLTFLPSAPRIEVIQLAQSILALNPLVLVTDDTVNEEKRPVLTRIFSMDLTNASCFDYQFPSLLYTKDVGVLAVDERPTDIDDYPLLVSLKQEWTHLQTVLQGRYVVAFHLPLVQTQLAVTAQGYGLPLPVLVGHSLLDLLLKYGRVKEPVDASLDENAPPLSDSQLCTLLAEQDVAPFVDSASGSADQRAQHLLRALQAISEGTFSLQEPLPISSLQSFAYPY